MSPASVSRLSGIIQTMKTLRLKFIQKYTNYKLLVFLIAWGSLPLLVSFIYLDGQLRLNAAGLKSQAG